MQLKVFYSYFFSVFIWLICGTCVASIEEALRSINQQCFLKYWETLSEKDRKALHDQLDHIDMGMINTLQQLIRANESIASDQFEPFLDFTVRGSLEDFALGKQLIAEGKVGCLIVAGGQGTRLSCSGPKGIVPVTLIKHKSLFQLVAEKVLAASRQAKRPLLLAIMTSSANHEATIHYFQEHQYFGLEPVQVSIFSQEDLPLLDANGDLFLEAPARIAVGPDGNAPSLKHFVTSGIWTTWYEQGVRYLNYVHIDNPLTDPFDAELTGFHQRQVADVILKCIARDDPMERLGVILLKNGRYGVAEYSEVAPLQRDARHEDGTLVYPCGSISLFSFSMKFVYDVALKYYDQVPYHKAWKAAKYMTPDGVTQLSEKPMAWKFEKFIFDVLPFANNVKALLYPREECFAPLKNLVGAESLKDVQQALLRHDRTIFAQISGYCPLPESIFELDPQFYYPTPEMLMHWRGKVLPEETYIDPWDFHLVRTP